MQTGYQNEYVLLGCKLDAKIPTKWKEFRLPLSIDKVEEWSHLQKLLFFKISTLDSAHPNSWHNLLHTREFVIEDDHSLQPDELQSGCGYFVCGWEWDPTTRVKSIVPSFSFPTMDQEGHPSPSSSSSSSSCSSLSSLDSTELQQFCLITECSPQEAYFYLSSSQLNLEMALQTFIDSIPCYFDTNQSCTQVSHLLFVAISQSNLEKCKCLFSLEFINHCITDAFGKNCIHYACNSKQCHYSILEYLQSQTTLQSIQNNSTVLDHQTPMHLACIHDLSQHVKLLLSSNSDVLYTSVDVHGYTPLQYCWKEKSVMVLNELLLLQYTIVVDNEQENNAMMESCILHECNALFDYLLPHSYNHLIFLFHLAVYHHRLYMIQQLVAKIQDMDWNIFDDAWQYTLYHNQISIATLLFDYGHTHGYEYTTTSMTPLQCLCQWSNSLHRNDLYSYVTLYQSLVNTCHTWHSIDANHLIHLTPLMISVIKSNHDMLELLLSSATTTIQLDLQDPILQKSALHYAMEFGNQLAVIKLMEAGATVTILDALHHTPFYYCNDDNLKQFIMEHYPLQCTSIIMDIQVSYTTLQMIDNIIRIPLESIAMTQSIHKLISCEYPFFIDKIKHVNYSFGNAYIVLQSQQQQQQYITLYDALFTYHEQYRISIKNRLWIAYRLASIMRIENEFTWSSHTVCINSNTNHTCIIIPYVSQYQLLRNNNNNNQQVALIQQFGILLYDLISNRPFDWNQSIRENTNHMQIFSKVPHSIITLLQSILIDSTPLITLSEISIQIMQSIVSMNQQQQSLPTELIPLDSHTTMEQKQILSEIQQQVTVSQNTDNDDMLLFQQWEHWMDQYLCWNDKETTCIHTSTNHWNKIVDKAEQVMSAILTVEEIHYLKTYFVTNHSHKEWIHKAFTLLSKVIQSLYTTTQQQQQQQQDLMRVWDMMRVWMGLEQDFQSLVVLHHDQLLKPLFEKTVLQWEQNNHGWIWSSQMDKHGKMILFLLLVNLSASKHGTWYLLEYYEQELDYIVSEGLESLDFRMVAIQLISNWSIHSKKPCKSIFLILLQLVSDWNHYWNIVTTATNAMISKLVQTVIRMTRKFPQFAKWIQKYKHQIQWEKLELILSIELYKTLRAFV